MKNMLKDAAILFAITVIAGLILGFVYNVTKEPIALAEEKAANEAYAEVFAGATEFEEVTADMDAAYVAEWDNAGFAEVDVDKVLTAKDNSGTQLGYVLTMTSHAGYGGDITFTLGISGDGTVNGISILSISETAGLGMKAEDVLKPQYAGKKVSSFVVTKQGALADNQIDAISGATITSNALTTAVNGGLYYFETKLGGVSYEAK